MIMFYIMKSKRLVPDYRDRVLQTRKIADQNNVKLCASPVLKGGNFPLPPFSMNTSFTGPSFHRG